MHLCLFCCPQGERGARITIIKRRSRLYPKDLRLLSFSAIPPYIQLVTLSYILLQFSRIAAITLYLPQYFSNPFPLYIPLSSALSLSLSLSLPLSGTQECNHTGYVAWKGWKRVWPLSRCLGSIVELLQLSWILGVRSFPYFDNE